MKIYGNSELLSLRVKIDVLSKSFTTNLEQINNEFTPNFIRLKKKKDNLVYYIVLTLFMLLFITIAVVLGIIYALYLILLLYGVNLIFTGIGLFFLRKVNKEYKFVKNKWDKDYQRVLRIQTEASGLYKLAEQEVYKTITLTQNYEELQKYKDDKNRYDKLYESKLAEVKLAIGQELGTNYTSEAVVAYYIQWGDNCTKENKSDFDFLEARRRKAELRSGKVDIDSE